MESTILSIIVVVIIDAVIVAFGYGQWTQKVKALEGKGNNNNGHHQSILPECQVCFNGINAALSQVRGDVGEIKGKVDTAIALLKDGKH